MGWFSIIIVYKCTKNFFEIMLFRRSNSRRRNKELQLVRQHGLEKLAHPSEVITCKIHSKGCSQEVYLANYESAFSLYNVTITELWQLIIEILPSVKELPFNDQVTPSRFVIFKLIIFQRNFFRDCMPQFVMAECFFHTKKIWGGFTK